MGPVSFYLEGVRKKEMESPRLAPWGEGGELRSGFLVLIKGEAKVDLNGDLDTYIDRITNSVIVAVLVLIIILVLVEEGADALATEQLVRPGAQWDPPKGLYLPEARPPRGATPPDARMWGHG